MAVQRFLDRVPSLFAHVGNDHLRAMAEGNLRISLTDAQGASRNPDGLVLNVEVKGARGNEKSTAKVDYSVTVVMPRLR